MKVLNAGLVLAVVTGLFAAGCETTTTPDSAMSLSPDSVELKAGMTQVFDVSLCNSNIVLNLPLVWTVSDSSLGIIKSSAGLSAVYEAHTSYGNNSITVRDQGDATGVAVVNQRY